MLVFQNASDVSVTYHCADDGIVLETRTSYNEKSGIQAKEYSDASDGSKGSGNGNGLAPTFGHFLRDSGLGHSVVVRMIRRGEWYRGEGCVCEGLQGI